jgi:hypothetical protein
MSERIGAMVTQVERLAAVLSRVRSTPAKLEVIPKPPTDRATAAKPTASRIRKKFSPLAAAGAHAVDVPARGESAGGRHGGPAPSSAGDVARLTDRDPGPQWVGAIGAMTMDIDLGPTPPPVSSWGMLHHNLRGVTIVLGSGAAFPGLTHRDEFDPGGAYFFHRFSTVTARYWRVQMPALSPAAAPLIGELLLGVPREIADKPTLPSGYAAVVGNVVRDRSPAGIPWATRRGPARARQSFEWAGMLQADLTTLLAAYAETREGALPLLVEDPLGIVRWMTWTDPEIAAEGLGNGLFHVRSTFEEVPL